MYLGGFVRSALVQRDEANEASYDYGMVLASSRSQGVDFWGASGLCKDLLPRPTVQATSKTNLLQICLGTLAAHTKLIMH